MIVLANACTTSRENSLRLSRNDNDELTEADTYFQQGQYKRAMMKYTSYVYSPFPNKTNLAYARYKLGLSHFMLEQYPEAFSTLENLLEETPDFPQAKQAQELMQKAQAKMSVRKQELEQKQQELMQKIVQMEQFVQQDPNNAEYHFQLGNYYWDVGLYTKSLEQYQLAANLNPAYLDQTSIRNRVRITSEGHYTFRDPIYEIDQPKEIRIIKGRMQRIERDNWLGEQDFIRYSGEVENQGLRDVRNVRIQVTLYDFFERIQGTQVIKIGLLPAEDDDLRGNLPPFSRQPEGLWLLISVRYRLKYSMIYRMTAFS